MGSFPFTARRGSEGQLVILNRVRYGTRNAYHSAPRMNIITRVSAHEIDTEIVRTRGANPVVILLGLTTGFGGHVPGATPNFA